MPANVSRILRAMRLADDLALVRDGQRMADRLFEVHARELIKKLKEAMSSVLDVPVAALEIGRWSCPTSPTGYCWYNLEKDHDRDDCLYCHEPAERK